MCESFAKEGYLKALKGKADKDTYEITEEFATAVAEDAVALPDEYKIFEEGIAGLSKRVTATCQECS